MNSGNSKILGLLIGLFLLLESVIAFSQAKPVVDEKAIENWLQISPKAGCISGTGKYVAYSVFSTSEATATGVIQMVGDRQKKIVVKGGFVSRPIFIKDDYCVFLKRDSLFAIDLHQLKVNFLASNATQPEYGDNLNLKFQQQDEEGKSKIVLLDLKTGKRKVVETAIKNRALLKTDNHNVNSVWLLDKNRKLQLICDDRTLQQEKNVKILSVDGITPTGMVKLTLTDILQKPEERIEQTRAKLTIWDYTNWQKQLTEEYKIVDDPLRYTGFIFPSQTKITLLEDETHIAKKVNADTWLVGNRQPAVQKLAYGPQPSPNAKFYYLLNERNGFRISLDKLDSTSNKTDIHFTRNKQFLVYYDTELGDFHGYDVKKKVTINLTRGVSRFKRKNNDEFSKGIFPYRNYDVSAGLFTNLEDGSLIVRDGFGDLWRIDPSGKDGPICITNHYAENNNVSFRDIVETGRGTGSKMVVVGYDSFAKTKSLFEITTTKPSVPRKVILKDCDFNRLTKASNANVWLYLKSSASESPNWFVTDGNTTKQISDVHPEKLYNWMKAELMNWKTGSGVDVQGILYRPENLDNQRKYPVIINYYGIRSDDFHEFQRPKLMHSGEVNIPWMVSRGYMVFVPDMRYRVGERGKSALECLESGVDELIKRKYIDKDRIGLNGHSHGGWETAYFITHSNRYKAAMIGAPGTNMLSRANDWRPNGNAFSLGGPSNWIEKGQPSLLRSLWDRPDWYIQNSPIFYADKVTTPVLMIHNRDDMSVPFGQGAEFFLSLSRLGKPAWLLQYDKEGHTFGNNDVQMDLTTRVVQFFNHYLKGEPAPLWMLDGIAYKDRAHKTGLQLDTLGRMPGKSPLISEAEQKRIDEYSKIPLSEKLKRIKD